MYRTGRKQVILKTALRCRGTFFHTGLGFGGEGTEVDVLDIIIQVSRFTRARYRIVWS